MKTKIRYYDIDWLRVLGMFMIFLFHNARFFNEDSYKESGFLEERAVIVALTKLSHQEVAAEDDPKGDQVKPAQKPAREEMSESIIDRHRTAPRDAVVDLHIGELVDNIAGMSGHDMLNIQLSYFEKCLDSAIAGNYSKVTFIHGVGNGALKNALVKKLKEYENLENHMASLAKFGIGAIDVVIRPLK